MVLPTSTIKFSDLNTEFGTSGAISMSTVRGYQMINTWPTSNISLSTLQGGSFNRFQMANYSNNCNVIYDSINDVQRLNQTVNNTQYWNNYFNLYVNSNSPVGGVYSNNLINFEGAVIMNGSNVINTGNTLYMRHSGLVTHLNTYTANSFDFTWEFIQAGVSGVSNVFYIRNAYAPSGSNSGVAGYSLGYDSNNDQLTITNVSTSTANPRIHRWYMRPLNYATQYMNIKPLIAMYANISITAADLKAKGVTNGTSNNSSLSLYAGAPATIQPTFLGSGGYSNNSYLNFTGGAGNSTTSPFYSNIVSYTLNCSNNTLNSWLGIANQPGFTHMMLLANTDLTNTSLNCRFYDAGIDANGSNIQVYRPTTNANAVLAYSVSNVLTLSANGILASNVWKCCAFRYNNSSLRGEIFVTSSNITSTNLSNILQASGTGSRAMSNYVIPVAGSYIGRSHASANPYAMMKLDSMYVCDNYVDDNTLISSMNTLISNGSYQ